MKLKIQLRIGYLKGPGEKYLCYQIWYVNIFSIIVLCYLHFTLISCHFKFLISWQVARIIYAATCTQLLSLKYVLNYQAHLKLFMHRISIYFNITSFKMNVGSIISVEFIDNVSNRHFSILSIFRYLFILADSVKLNHSTATFMSSIHFALYSPHNLCPHHYLTKLPLNHTPLSLNRYAQVLRLYLYNRSY